MRRVLLVLIGTVALLLTLPHLRGCFVSDQTLIRWRIERMVEGFNEARVSPCVRGVSSEWRDTRRGIDRALLADALRSTFFHEKDPRTKQFLHRVELEDELTIVLDDVDQARASVVLVARFETLRAGEWSPTWRVRIQAEMSKHPDDGWQAVRTDRETLWSDGRFVGSR